MALSDFIKDFKLATPNGCVCFHAMIDFIVNDKNWHIDSEVHILNIRAKNQFSVYLLNKVIDPGKWPDIFNETTDNMVYVPGKFLMIQGMNLQVGRYILTITPCRADKSNRIFKDSNTIYSIY